MASNGKKLVIGVDGGGTKTHGILYLEDGTTLAEDHFGSSNPHSNSEDVVRKNLHGLFDSLIKKADESFDNIDGVCLGMAGCDRPADKKFIEDIVKEKVGEEKRLLVVNDAVVAMVAVLEKLHGILIISGTGSICFGFNNRTGERGRCGGWGHILADEGSGYKIGLRAIQEIMKSYDGRIGSTSLTKRFLKHLDLNDPSDFIGWTYMGGNGKTEIADLGKIVHEEAELGDEVAQGIILEQAEELSQIVAPVYKKLFDEGEVVELALWGGNLLNVQNFQNAFKEKLAEHNLPLKPVTREAKAVVGAAKHILNSL